MVGRAECLEVAPATEHWKAKGLDLSPLLYVPEVPPDVARRAMCAQDSGLDAVLDRTIIAHAGPALERQSRIELSYAIRNTDRTTADWRS